MTLIYYDQSCPIKYQNLHNLIKHVKEITGDEVLVLPKTFEVLLNCSEEQLITAKNTIEAALKLKFEN